MIPEGVTAGFVDSAQKMKINLNDKTVGGFNYEFLRCVSAQGAGAAELGECIETMGRVKRNDFGSWADEWGGTADRAAAYAKQLQSAGDNVGAKKAFLRASNYYRAACSYAHHSDPRHRDYWQKSKDAFRLMTYLSEREIEHIEIIFDKSALPGYFIPSGTENGPTLIAIGGFDSAAEEIYYLIGSEAASYGWNCLIFDGPGQWGALMDNPGLVFCPDYEKPVGAAVDYLVARNDTDVGKIAIIGYSMGGYFSVRGAFDERIKACVANPLIVDCGALAKARLKILAKMKNEALADRLLKAAMKIYAPARRAFSHSSWALGIKTAAEWVKAYDKFTLRGFENMLDGKKMLFMFGEDDIADAAAADKSIISGLPDYIRSLKCEKYIKLFPKPEGASGHCQLGGLPYAHAAVFGWLWHVFSESGEIQPSGDADRFAALFMKYGGAEASAKAKDLLNEVTFI